MSDAKTPHDDYDLIPMQELWRRCKSYTSKRSRGPYWQPKSTKIGLWDIAILAQINQTNFYDWIYGYKKFGPVRQRRLSRIIRLLDGGYITKSQYKHYIIHDHPVVPPKVHLKVVVGVEGVRLQMPAPEKPPSGMPSFGKIFGGK
jgi:hypothetical protein